MTRLVQRRRARLRAITACLITSLAVLAAGCTEERNPVHTTPVVLASPSAVRNPPQLKPQDVLVLPVQIVNGQFDQGRYDVQAGAVRLQVTTQGGPYTLTIEPLVKAQQLPANTTTAVEFTAPNPGEYPMVLEDQGQARAVLNVRPLGSV